MKLTFFKRTISLLIASALLVSTLQVTVSAAECLGEHNYYDGICTNCGDFLPAELNDNETPDDTSDDYYEIDNPGNLSWFSQQVNNGNANINAKLMDDIELNPSYTFTFEPDTGLVAVEKDGSPTYYIGTGIAGNDYGTNTNYDIDPSASGQFYSPNDFTEIETPQTPCTWAPIGSVEKQYVGNFDGNNKSVSGIYINNDSASYVGLFGYNNGYVLNVTVENSYMFGYEHVGGVCGDNDNSIEACCNTGAVNGTDFVGGVCGYNALSIEACYNTGAVSGNGCVGGVCGYSDNMIENCYNIGVVNGTEYVGGVCGLKYGLMQNCYYLAESETDDYDGTTFKTSTQFADGTVTELLDSDGGSVNGLDWYQGSDYPLLFQPFDPNDNGTPDDMSDDYYEIANVNNILWFASRINTHANTTPNAKLIDDIDLNPGYTFNFESDTGLVAVEKDGSLTYYIGTGIKGNVGGNIQYDIDPSTRGQFYSPNDFTEIGTPQALCTWTPIGSEEKQYTGRFDGNNKSVTGVYINDYSPSGVGLFGASYGTIENLTVENSCVNGNGDVGGVCGLNSGSILNCHNTGTVNGNSRVGGVCGTSCNVYNDRFIYCYNTGTVNGNINVGGVCGFGLNAILNCYNTGVVSGDDNVGGVCGDGLHAIKDCYNIGCVSGISNVGNVCGFSESSIENCYYLAESETDDYDGTTFKTYSQFVNGTVAWLLNTDGGDYNHTGIWSQGETAPIFADDTHIATFKISISGAKSIDYYTDATGKCAALETVHADGADADTIHSSDTSYIADAAIIGVTPTVTDHISLGYQVSLAGEAAPTLVINFDGEIITLQPIGRQNGDYTTYTFTFDGILPQQFTKNISMSLMVNDDVYATKSNYSVQTYAFDRIKASDSVELKAFLVNMLYYGEAIQRNLNQTESLATEGLTDILDADTINSYRIGNDDWSALTLTSAKSVAGTNATDLITWKSATLLFDKTITMRIRFEVTEANLGALSECDFVTSFTRNELGSFVHDDGNIYYIDITGFIPTDYQTAVTLVLNNAEGSAVSKTVTYSVQSYIASMKASAMGTLVRALYDYGVSGKNYSDKL